MDVLRKTAACTHSLHHGSRTENVRNFPPRFLRQGGKDNENHHRRFGRHHAHGHRRGETIEMPAGHILKVVRTAPESIESTGVQPSDFARTVRMGRHGSHGGQGRHGISESEDSHGTHGRRRSQGRHGSHGGFHGGHRRGEMSAGLVAGRETGGEGGNMTAGEGGNMTAGGISERGASGWKSHGERHSRHGRHGSHGSHGRYGGRGMRHVTNDVSAPTADPKSEGGDVSLGEV